MGDHLDNDQLIKKTLAAFQILEENMKQCNEQGINPVELLNVYYYTPHEALRSLLEEFRTFLEKESPSQKERQDVGYLLEQIAIISFGCLRGFNNLKSYQSASAQYDLLISGNSPEWNSFFSLLNLSDLPKGILLEAKAIKAPISDTQFSRLCSLIDHNFSNSVGIGVFFSINSLSGLPDSKEKRLRKASDGYLKQIIFYCRAKIPIIVFDKSDILQLDQKGSLVKILDRKIRELEEMTGTKIDPEESMIIDIPPKFSEVLKCLEKSR